MGPPYLIGYFFVSEAILGAGDGSLCGRTWLGAVIDAIETGGTAAIAIAVENLGR
jgi:hypothetical protein